MVTEHPPAGLPADPLSSYADLPPLPAAALIDPESATDVPRLHRRVDAYGQAAALPAASVSGLHDLLASPLGRKVHKWLPRMQQRQFANQGS